METLTIEQKAELFDKIVILIGNYKITKPKKDTITKPMNESKPISHLLEDEIMKTAYGESTLRAFCQYWGEQDTRGKERRQKEKIFNIKQRLDRWKYNEMTNFGKNPLVTYESMNEFDIGMRAGKQEEMKSKLGIDKFIKMKQEWKDSEFYLR